MPATPKTPLLAYKTGPGEGLLFRRVSGTPSAQYSIVLRVEIDHRPGALGAVASAIGAAGA